VRPAEKLRVLQVVPSLQPGGAERMMVHLLLALDRSRHVTGAVSLYGGEQGELDSMLAEAGVPVWHLGKQAGFDASMYVRLSRVLRQFQPHVVHAHLNTLPYIVPPAASRHSPLMVYTAHNFPALLVPPSLRWFYRACFHHGVVAVSIAKEISRSLRVEFGLEAVPLIPNGIPVSRYRSPQVPRSEWRRTAGFSSEDTLLVCVARLSAQKNHSLLLEAFAAGLAWMRGVHLLLAGDGDLRDTLVRQASALGLASRVHFLGNRRDIPELLAACDVFVLSSAAEGNPLCVMEAMAAGLPVISTAVGGVPELVEPGTHGLLTEPNNVRQLSAAMSLLVESPNLRLTLGQNAACRAMERFDASTMAQAYEELYGRHLPTRHTVDQKWLREPKRSQPR
jgi:glycosyltransferase involved in cell wall biosynthesis